ncbi:unnamed protein product [Paramecium pentaurelia]|uniref:WD40-repeat-containing domain n=1 Tax=Paramecium pentaurelia TaxID=43138 RepID=A0A8S1WKH1_9CILI|nr:unnamed protein product [Paramecium pentaurelia]
MKSIMGRCRMIEDLDKITCKGQHNDKISLLVMLENDLQNEQRLYCEKCLQTKKGVLNAIPFDEAKSRIEKQQNRHFSELNYSILQRIKFIDEFSENIIRVLQTIEQFIKDCEQRIKLWQDQLIKFRDDNYTYSLIQELSNLKKEENQWVQEKYLDSQNQINLIDQDHSLHLKFTVDEIQQQVQNIVKAHELLQDNIQIHFKNLINQSQKEQEQEQLQKENIQLSQRFFNKLFNKLVQEIRQNEICYAIGFNQNDSIMAAGFNECIKIWKIENGQFIDSQIILKGKSEVDFAICITFSKRKNLFVYGSYDHSIGIWNEIENGQWNPSDSSNEMSHSGMVTCILFNQCEDQVISGSQDKSIIIWKFNGTSIKFDQQLIKHKNTIFNICMNQQETEIASMSKDQQIIIWVKISNKWKIKQIIQQSNINFGDIVTFISNDVLVLYQNFQKFTYARSTIDTHFTQISEQSLDLTDIVKNDEQYLFPTFHFIHKNLIVQKKDGNVYFVVVDEDFQPLSLSKLYINQKNTFYGNITNNGRYLVIWSFGDLEFKIYKLSYL